MTWSFSWISKNHRKKYSTSGKKEVESPFKMIRTMRLFFLNIRAYYFYVSTISMVHILMCISCTTIFIMCKYCVYINIYLCKYIICMYIYIITYYICSKNLIQIFSTWRGWTRQPTEQHGRLRRLQWATQGRNEGHMAFWRSEDLWVVNIFHFLLIFVSFFPRQTEFLVILVVISWSL